MCPDDVGLANWALHIQRVVAPYQYQVQYGNLRMEFRRWPAAAGAIANLALVYEVPGGSTDQINVSFHEAAQQFVYLLESGEERCTDSRDEVVRCVQQAIVCIPRMRRQRLRDDIDRWIADGLTRPALYRQLAQLLHVDDLRGGAITVEEMRDGIAYIVARDRD